MKSKRKDIRRHELIGLQVKITKASNPTLVGLKGEVVDETKNTLKIRTGGVVRQVLKSVCTFDFAGTLIDGSGLLGRPEDRLKKVKK